MNIYEMTHEYLVLQEMMEDPDVDAETLADTMEAIEGEIEDKVLGYGKVIKNVEASMNGLDAEITRLTKMRDACEANIDRLKKNVFTAMQITGKTKIKTELFTFGIQKNGGKAPLLINEGVTADDVPDEFVKLTASIDNSKVRKALEEGCELEWAHIGERGEHLSIR